MAPGTAWAPERRGSEREFIQQKPEEDDDIFDPTRGIQF